MWVPHIKLSPMIISLVIPLTTFRHNGQRVDKKTKKTQIDRVNSPKKDKNVDVKGVNCQAIGVAEVSYDRVQAASPVTANTNHIL